MPSQFTGTISLTSDATTVAPGFRPTFLRVDSATANTVFLSFSTVIATTASTIGYPLTSGAASLIFPQPAVPVVNGFSSQFTAVTSAGGTTVVRVLAVRI
jgi:hypothetical protein